MTTDAAEMHLAKTGMGPTLCGLADLHRVFNNKLVYDTFFVVGLQHGLITIERGTCTACVLLYFAELE